MNFLFGMIVGALLTVLGTYIADSRSATVEQRRIVNWDVVGQRLDTLTADAQSVWNDFTREMTGPP
ncbi:MAG: hypothetical protein ACR2GC_05365 [Methyloceanibacter sp.]|uniref:hypothetical protein n=1 Tax=Methyloceanibacter sp. TaxID=1965321 RepID=UPI003D9B8B98